MHCECHVKCNTCSLVQKWWRRSKKPMLNEHSINALFQWKLNGSYGWRIFPSQTPLEFCHVHAGWKFEHPSQSNKVSISVLCHNVNQTITNSTVPICRESANSFCINLRHILDKSARRSITLSDDWYVKQEIPWLDNGHAVSFHVHKLYMVRWGTTNLFLPKLQTYR